MDFVALAQECAPWVAHETMAAIVKTESAFRPLAIGVNGGARLARQPENKAEAVATAEWLIANGYNIDMGLAQVNSANLRKTGLTVEDAFDACKNLTAAATILHGNYQAARRKVQGEQAALHAALSAYNTGSFTRGFSNGYVQKVVFQSTPVTGRQRRSEEVTPPERDYPPEGGGFQPELVFDETHDY
jgi:type IV secretion system protein VirB1